MIDKVFLSIIYISIIYIFLVLFFRNNKIKQVITKNKVKQTNGKIDSIIDDVITSPNRLVVNLIYSEKENIDLDLFADMSIRYNDLLNGTYKVPDHLKKNKVKNIIENIIETKPIQKPEINEPILKIHDIKFDNLINISQINKQV